MTYSMALDNIVQKEFADLDGALIDAIVAGPSAFREFNSRLQKLRVLATTVAQSTTSHTKDLITAVCLSCSSLLNGMSNLHAVKDDITAKHKEDICSALERLSLKDDDDVRSEPSTSTNLAVATTSRNLSPRLPRGTRESTTGAEDILPAIHAKVLYGWLVNNIHSPYPSTQAKAKLAQEVGKDSKYVANWFINARRRIGWSSLARKHFQGKRTLIVDFAYRVLVEQPQSVTDADLTAEIRKIKRKATRLYESFCAELSLDLTSSDVTADDNEGSSGPNTETRTLTLATDTMTKMSCLTTGNSLKGYNKRKIQIEDNSQESTAEHIQRRIVRRKRLDTGRSRSYPCSTHAEAAISQVETTTTTTTTENSLTVVNLSRVDTPNDSEDPSVTIGKRMTFCGDSAEEVPVSCKKRTHASSNESDRWDESSTKRRRTQPPPSPSPAELHTDNTISQDLFSLCFDFPSDAIVGFDGGVDRLEIGHFDHPQWDIDTFESTTSISPAYISEESVPRFENPLSVSVSQNIERWFLQQTPVESSSQEQVDMLLGLPIFSQPTISNWSSVFCSN